MGHRAEYSHPFKTWARGPTGRSTLAAVGSLLCCLGLTLCVALPLAAQDGRVAGTVTAAESGEPLSGVQVFLDGTNYGAITGDDGRYAMTGIPPGTYRVEVRMIGYANQREDNVRVREGETTTVDFDLPIEAFSIEEVVVTGVVDPIEGVKLPFSVGRLSTEDLSVPAPTSAAASLQGKVSGVSIVRGSGRPGSGVSINLRTPTTINKSNAPLFVVDGVILGQSTIDVETLDIESIEVIKGAAASSLYGSRAANGVVQITTNRGQGLERGNSRIRLRTEFGTSQLANKVPLNTAHPYLLNDEGQFVDSDGNPTEDSGARVTDPDGFIDNEYPVPIYDNLDAFYSPGQYLTQHVSLSQNTNETNFSLSANEHREKGVLETIDGYQRRNFRFNLDHRMGDRFSVAATAYHNRSWDEDLSGSPFWDLLMYTPEVDLGRKDEDGNFMQFPDSTVRDENPVWRQTSRENYSERMRSLAAGDVRFNPVNWLRFYGNVSYDRSDRHYSVYVPKGTPFQSGEESEGVYRLNQYKDDALNASARVTLLYAVGDLTTRTSAQALLERETDAWFQAEGTELLVQDVPDLSVAGEQAVASSLAEIRSTGYFLNAGLDYAGKYVADFMVRRDGSSLFGPENRWHTYYRAAFAYRMAQEPWWPFPSVNEFKPRYARGTAGGRPSFSDRYETWSVSASGDVSRGTMGNAGLRPEHTTEQEFGLDAIVLDRYSFSLVYASQVTEDQLIQLPIPAVLGFGTQWGNSGTMEGNTLEAELEARLISTPDLGWTVGLVADRSNGKVTEWNRPCYRAGTGSISYRCGGVTVSKIYGMQFLTSADQLPSVHSGSTGHFDVNDDGYLVAVGEGNSWRDGVAKDLWGTTVEVDGETYDWGLPIVKVDEETGFADALVNIGNSAPDARVGVTNLFRWRGFNIYSLVDMQIGGNIYNRTKQRLYQHDRHADVNQADKPEERKKPRDYYQALYHSNDEVSHFVEPGGYVKLRELSVRYDLTSNQLDRFGLGWTGLDRASVNVIGRNLLTFTDYTGFDPDVGSVRFRYDNFSYPNYRTLTTSVELQF